MRIQHISLIMVLALLACSAYAARVGDRIDITSIINAAPGFVCGDIKYTQGYQPDQSKGTMFEAVVTAIVAGTGQPASYSIVYKGTSIEPNMTVIERLIPITIDLRADVAHVAGWQIFHLTDAQNAVTPFPALHWAGGGNHPAGNYGYLPVSNGIGGYTGDKYDAMNGTALSNSGTGNGVWTNAGATMYACFRKQIKIDSTLLSTSGSITVSGHADDDVHIFLRNGAGTISAIYSDAVVGAGNFSGTVNLGALTTGTNSIEVYATNVVFSGTNAARDFRMDMTPVTLMTIGRKTKARYRADANGNIYDDFGIKGWSNYSQTAFAYSQSSNSNKVIDNPRIGTSGDDQGLYDYVAPPSFSDKIGTIPAIAQSASGSSIQKTCNDTKEFASSGKCWGWLQTHTYDLGSIIRVITVSGNTIAGPSEVKGKAYSWEIRTSVNGTAFTRVASIAATGAQKTAFGSISANRDARFIQIFANNQGCIDYSDLSVTR